MKTTAIIAEFNPFHNGHGYIIGEAKKKSDAVACVMSGSFVQRGDVAVFDKYTRARAAVLCGADLVLELPAVFACSTAERFAFGAVSLIKNLGVIDEIVFGAECEDTKLLEKAARLYADEPPEISEKIKKYLSEGIGFPAAREKAYAGLIDGGILSSPNNILAVEYMKAAFSADFDVKFRAVRRIGDYHSADMNVKYASATAVRREILSGRSVDVQVPEKAAKIYKSAAIFDLSRLDNTIMYLLRTLSPEELSEINDVSEGLENALKKAALTHNGFASVADALSGKRYTRTKISRILVSVLLGIDKKIVRREPNYARVLAFNDTGRQIINAMKKNLPVIVKTADFKEKNKMFEKDILATDIAFLCSNGKKIGGVDFLTPPQYVSE